jgi:hypothetical protein
MEPDSRFAKPPPPVFNAIMNLIKIGDCYFNLAGITHIEFENEMRGLICTVHFNCQITDRDGANGIQACKILTGAAARELRNILDKHAILPELPAPDAATVDTTTPAAQ